MACTRHPMLLSFLGQQCIWMNKHSTRRLKVWTVNDEGNALRNYFTLHWSTEAVKEALEKDNVIRTLFRVNTYHRLNAHCAIDGVKIDALINGLASHTTHFILENQHSSCHFSHYPTFILLIPVLPPILYTHFSFPVCMKPMHVPLLTTPHLTMSLPSFLSISPLPNIIVTPPHHVSKSRYRSLTQRVPRRIGLNVSVWYRAIRKKVSRGWISINSVTLLYDNQSSSPTHFKS